jgi:hypothetical protein
LEPDSLDLSGREAGTTPTRIDTTGRTPAIGGQRLILLLIGLYIISAGIAIIWIPRELWQNIAAVFFILTGIWFIVRGYSRSN